MIPNEILLLLKKVLLNSKRLLIFGIILLTPLYILTFYLLFEKINYATSLYANQKIFMYFSFATFLTYFYIYRSLTNITILKKIMISYETNNIEPNYSGTLLSNQKVIILNSLSETEEVIMIYTRSYLCKVFLGSNKKFYFPIKIL